MGDRDVLINQIREELANRDLVLADQAKQLRYELTRDCSLCQGM